MNILKLLFLSFMIVGTVYANPSKLRSIEWKEISNHNGILVYRPTTFDHNSGLVPIKFKAVIKHPIGKVLTVLANEKRKLEWMPKLKEIKLLERKSIQDFTVYYRYSAPWPFKDRDFVIQNLGSFDPKTFVVSVDLISVKNEKKPETSKTVRGTTYDAYSIISPDSNGNTNVEMAFLNDFGGLIPKFIVNIVQKSWPHKFMKHLRSQLDKTDIEIMPEFKIGQDAKFLRK